MTNADGDRPLLLDEIGERLDRFAALRKTDSAAADAVLDELGAEGTVDRDIVTQLAANAPLALPGRFEEAHALAMRALEVLDRNGARPVKLRHLGPLAAVAKPVVQLVTRYIVRNYEAHLIDSLRNLYTRRLAWSQAGDPQRFALYRALRDVERAIPAYKRKAVGLPTFLIGGAALSSVGSGLRGVAESAGQSGQVGAVASVAIVAVLAGAGWAILRGSAVARRRIRLTVERPLAALWETVGRAGRPPQDPSRSFALVAIVVTVVATLVVPVAVVWVVAEVT